MANAANRAARKVWPLNRDPALECGDSVYDIPVSLNRECGGRAEDEALRWQIVFLDPLDVLRKRNRRAHTSLNGCTEDKDGNMVDRAELMVGSSGFEEQVLARVYIEETIPTAIMKIGLGGLEGGPGASAPGLGSCATLGLTKPPSGVEYHMAALRTGRLSVGVG